jgi:hypothetical protein
MNTHVTVSDIHHDVVNTHTIVSDIHRNMLESQGGANGQHQPVSDTCTRFIVE